MMIILSRARVRVLLYQMMRPQCRRWRVARGQSATLSKQIDLEQRIVNPVKKLHLIEKPLNWREFKYPFVYGQADFKLFSHSDWRDCARQALGARDFGSLAGDFGHSDDPLLVNYIAHQSLPQRGIVMKPENVLVTMGAQNALYLIADLLINSFNACRR